MITNLEQKLKDLSLVAFPREACAFCSEEEVYPIKNISQEETSFLLCPIETAKLYLKLGDFSSIKYLWHSHCKQVNGLFDIRTPSEADMLLHKKLKLPLLISGYDGNKFFSTIEFPSQPSLDKNLTGRPYICGVFDCGILLRDVFLRDLGISLNYEFQASYLSLRNWPEAVKTFLTLNGFEEVFDGIKPYDVLVVPMFNIQEAHGVLVTEEGKFVLDQRETSRLIPIEEYLYSPHKVYRFNKIKFLERF
jgi:hypothetical protein